MIISLRFDRTPRSLTRAKPYARPSLWCNSDSHTNLNSHLEDDTIYAVARLEYVKLSRIKREKLRLLERIETGSCKRKEARPQNIAHGRIIDGNFGRPTFTKDGVVHGTVPPYLDVPKFHKRNRIGPELFSWLLDEITDSDTRKEGFLRGPDVVGENGASALLNVVMRQMAYWVSFDVVQEYTGVAKGGARQAQYTFCDWLDVRHGGKYMGVWTEEAIDTQMEISTARGFKGCWVAYIIIIGPVKSAPCHGPVKFGTPMVTSQS